MSNPGDRMTAISDIPGDDERRTLEAIECPEVYRFKGHAGCRSCHGTGILWREVKDAEKKV